MIQVGIASMAKRAEALTDTLNSLLNQSTPVTRITVYLQEGHPIDTNIWPGHVQFIRHDPKRKYLGDAHKFVSAGQDSGIFFACDDDLIYPHDYIEKQIDALKRYDNKAIIGLHGVIIKPNARHYYADRIVYHGLKYRKKDIVVHLVATCSCAWDMSVVKFGFNDCTESGMADIWLGLYAQRHNVPSVAVAYPPDWVVHTDKINLKDTIFTQESSNPMYVGNKYIVISWKLFDP